MHGLQQVVGKREISMEIRNLQGLMQHWLPQVKGNTDALPAKAAAALN